MKFGIVIPTYGQFQYAARAIHTAYWNTYSGEGPPYIYVMDDGSPDWWAAPDVINNDLLPLTGTIDPSCLCMVHFEKNEGLTRCWNEGLNRALCDGCDYVCVTNSDVIFPLHWNVPLIQALNGSFNLVGPVTNAPGTEKEQDVSRYMTGRSAYVLTDEQKYIERLQKALFTAHHSTCLASSINGFCMVAKRLDWLGNAYAKEQCFKPYNAFNSKRQRNPTPTMTLNEYELQKRWRNAGLHTGYCPGSFVFHYRAVSRGDEFKQGKWFRMKA